MRLKPLRSRIFSGLILTVIGQFVFGFLWVWSQEYGNCDEGKASVILVGENVRARILNTGGLFWNGDPHIYEVPKGSGSMSLFSASLIVGGMVDKELRMSAASYGAWEMWPGPLDNNGHPPVECSVYDRIYRISRQDITRFNEYAVTDNPDLVEWPVELGAPVRDGDGNPDNYDPYKGDRPGMLGDRYLWWVMNDRGNEHRASGALPLGMEVQASAFTTNFGLFSGFSTATFYHYLFIYKGRKPVDSLYVGVFNDVDLGDAGDDLVGSDSLSGLGFGYNADDFDGSYGNRPPAIGMLFVDLDPNDGFDTRTSSAAFVPKSGGQPRSKEQWYNVLRCLDKHGNILTEDYASYYSIGDGPRTCFTWPGDPVSGEGYSMERDGVPGGDRHFFVSTGPFNLAPGDSLNLHFAILWARGENRFDSITRLKNLAANVKAAFTLSQVGPPYPWDPNREEPTVPGFIPAVAGELVPHIGSAFPNPAATSISFNFWVPAEQVVTIRLVDVLGRLVFTKSVYVSKGENQESLPLSEIPAGIYLLEVTGLHGSNSTKVAVVR